MSAASRSLLRRGAFLTAGKRLVPHVAVAERARGTCSREMSTSVFAKGTGSMLGKYSAKVRQGDVMQAFEDIQRREKLMRLDEMAQRHAFHEKGYEKTRRKKSLQKWQEYYRIANAQARWMSVLEMKGVQVPGTNKNET